MRLGARDWHFGLAADTSRTPTRDVRAAEDTGAVATSRPFLPASPVYTSLAAPPTATLGLNDRARAVAPTGQDAEDQTA